MIEGKNLDRTIGKDLARKRQMILYTQNVRSLYRPGALQIFINILQKYNIHIIALHEIRRTGKRIWESQKYRIYSSCNPNEHIFGTEFIVSD